MSGKVEVYRETYRTKTTKTWRIYESFFLFSQKKTTLLKLFILSEKIQPINSI